MRPVAPGVVYGSIVVSFLCLLNRLQCGKLPGTSTFSPDYLLCTSLRICFLSGILDLFSHKFALLLVVTAHYSSNC